MIWGDDIGQSNVSAYTKGLVGYRTPNIDRIADEGMIFTDYYGEQSCTAGRAAFITGQSVFRTGLSKVGLPGAELGLKKEDPTIATMLRPLGYSTGQFGKNHLGDRDEHLPTMHGFDEFFGNLYHLNAEEEPEHEDYPKNPEFRMKFGPRGVLHSWANADGTQRIEDTGPLTRKRMETVDDETSDAAIKFIQKARDDGKPFFVWWNGTRMHFRTHVKPELRGISGQDEYADGMVEHDRHVGKLLKSLDDLGLSENTIVFYWMEPFVPLRVPLIENLRRDPYERATITSNTYYDWLLERSFLVVPAQAYHPEGSWGLLLHKNQLPVLVAKGGQVTVVREVEDFIARTLGLLAGQ